MKNKQYISILMLIALITVAIIVYFILIKDKSVSTEKIYVTNESCLKKGNICTMQEIVDGILVKVNVTENETKDFYVISNTESEMVLMQNINAYKDVEWQLEGTNTKGPVEALVKTYTSTKNWTNIPAIENYIYEDYGKKISDELCALEYIKYYSCENLDEETRGYDGVYITKYKKMIDFNLSAPEGIKPLEGYDLEAYNLKARLITYEEYEKIKSAEWLGENLDLNNGFWTMTSSTERKVNYSQGAYAIVNINDDISLKSVNVLRESRDYDIGIRPVISISKR